ncbi:hypothetical protein CRW64_21630, partial [Salmonella enterica subsp. enterica serovar Newport]|nr:hypothetical protein [Salmonella enterica subsp. enterica serovar Newport]
FIGHGCGIPHPAKYSVPFPSFALRWSSTSISFALRRAEHHLSQSRRHPVGYNCIYVEQKIKDFPAISSVYHSYRLRLFVLKYLWHNVPHSPGAVNIMFS